MINTVVLPPRNYWIDCLRGYAILAVCVSHVFHLEPLRELEGYFIRALQQGAVGVFIFYFISGFLVVRILHEELSAPSICCRWTALRGFWMRRVFRLQPTFAMFVVVYYVIAFDASDHLPLATIILPISNWYDGPYATWHIKTLHLEEAFYVMSGLVFLIAIHRRVLVLSWLLVAFLLLRLAHRLLLKADLGLAEGLMSYTVAFEPIIWGGLLAMHLDKVRATALAGCIERFGAAYFIPAVLLMYVTGMLSAVKPFSFALVIFLPTIWSACAAVTLLAFLAKPSVFKNVVVHYIGTISYTLYLFQQFPLSRTSGMPMFSWYGFAMMFSVTIMFVVFWSRWIELPLARFGAKHYRRHMDIGNTSALT